MEQPVDPLRENVALEYSEAHATFRHLAEIRFKLLAFLPTLGGAAVFGVSYAGLRVEAQAVVDLNAALWVVLLVGLFGAMVTMGIVLYDQRNSELYNAVIHRAKYLERNLFIQRSPGALRRDAAWGGVFAERPSPKRRIHGIPAKHDVALALIYGAVLGAWAFPVVFPALRLAGQSLELSASAGALVSVVGALVTARRLVTIDDEDAARWNATALSDRPPS